MPHFSVIMPLYNKAPYVRKAVESVVGQTYVDWEMIIVDDCSTDGSAAIVEQFTDPRIRIVRLERNGGVGAARNRGVVESSTPLICFLDADDWWEPTFLEEIEGLIERYPNAGIYGTGYYIVKNGEKRGDHFSEHKDVSPLRFMLPIIPYPCGDCKAAMRKAQKQKPSGTLFSVPDGGGLQKMPPNSYSCVFFTHASQRGSALISFSVSL